MAPVKKRVFGALLNQPHRRNVISPPHFRFTLQSFGSYHQPASPLIPIPVAEFKAKDVDGKSKKPAKATKATVSKTEADLRALNHHSRTIMKRLSSLAKPKKHPQKFISMAEAIQQYQRKTPERYHTQPVGSGVRKATEQHRHAEQHQHAKQHEIQDKKID